MKNLLLLFGLMFVLLAGFTTSKANKIDRSPSYKTDSSMRLKLIEYRIKHFKGVKYAKSNTRNSNN